METSVEPPSCLTEVAVSILEEGENMVGAIQGAIQSDNDRNISYRSIGPNPPRMLNWDDVLRLRVGEHHQRRRIVPFRVVGRHETNSEVQQPVTRLNRFLSPLRALQGVLSVAV